MAGKVTLDFFLAVGLQFAAFVVIIGGLCALHLKYKKDKTVTVRVEHLREPLVAAINFIAICVALIAAVMAYGAANDISKTISFLVLSMFDFLFAGIAAIYFLFGLPNLAGTQETFTYRFSRDWDVVVFPSVVLVLIFLGTVSLGVYGFIEVHIPVPASEGTSALEINLCSGSASSLGHP
jgi:hypothetical protein